MHACMHVCWFVFDFSSLQDLLFTSPLILLHVYTSYYFYVNDYFIVLLSKQFQRKAPLMESRTEWSITGRGIFCFMVELSQIDLGSIIFVLEFLGSFIFLFSEHWVLIKCNVIIMFFKHMMIYIHGYLLFQFLSVITNTFHRFCKIVIRGGNVNVN